MFLEISSLPSAFTGALGKDISKKKLNLCRAPCQRHSAKYFQKKIFAECLTIGTRQRRTWPNTVTRGSLCRVPLFCREPGTRQLLCRVPFFAECPALGKELFAECNSLPSAALGKEGLCRVPDFLHSAKQFALGKDPVSSSDVTR